MLADTLTAVFLLLVGVVLPAFAAAGAIRLAAGERLPARRALYLQAMVTLGIMCALALAVARGKGIGLFPAPAARPGDLAAALGLLAVALGTVPLRWRFVSAERRERLRALVPVGGRDAGPYVLVCLCAGVCEEIIYRGVLFTLLSRATGDWWTAALVAALVFALSHLVQGWQSAALVLPFALGFQALVRLSGDLYGAMAVHALYDLAAGLIYARLARDTGAAPGDAPAGREGVPQGPPGAAPHPSAD